MPALRVSDGVDELGLQKDRRNWSRFVFDFKKGLNRPGTSWAIMVGVLISVDVVVVVVVVVLSIVSSIVVQHLKLRVIEHVTPRILCYFASKA